jgi:hypothetical protein
LGGGGKMIAIIFAMLAGVLTGYEAAVKDDRRGL